MTCVLENKSNLLDEKAKKTIRKALKILGKKNLAFIMHCGSFPSAPNQNTGFGSINSDGGKEFIEYASGLFDAIQLGPAGKTMNMPMYLYQTALTDNNYGLANAQGVILIAIGLVVVGLIRGIYRMDKE